MKIVLAWGIAITVSLVLLIIVVVAASTALIQAFTMDLRFGFGLLAFYLLLLLSVWAFKNLK